MDPLLLQPYLEMLKKHTSYIQVPGLKRNYSIPLAEIFIQPDIASPSTADEEVNAAKTRSGRKKKEKQKEPKSVAQAPLEPALGVLGRENQIVVLGDAGQGKSTLLRQYAFELAAVNGELPLYVELGQKREWTAPVPGEYTWIRERIPPAPRDKLRDEAWRACCDALDENRATLILDGFDELTEESRGELISLIETLKGNRLIISSRPQAYSPLSGFKVYKLALLRSEQVDSLAANFCRAMASERGLTDHSRALNKVLESAHGKGWAMVQNPLLLYFICLTAFSEESIPDRPAPLISKCIAELVLWEQRKKDSIWPKPEVFGAEDVIRILGQVALNSFSRTTGVVSEDALGEVLPDQRDRIRFRELIVPAGLIEQGESGYKFILDTFREYYAGRAVAADKDPFGKVKRQLHLPEWQRVILYTAGSLKDEKANWFHLNFPIFTAMLVTVIGPVVRIGGGLLKLAPVPGAIADAGREGLKETASAIQGPLERRLHRSRHSTEFFITSIWKHHCRWRWMRYESILWRDVRLASRCLAEIEAGPHRMVVPLADFILDDWKGGRLFQFSEERAIAVQNPNVLRYLISLTETKKSRSLAARGLASAATQPEVQERLLELIAQDSDKVVINNAFEALTGPTTDVKVLRHLLKLSRDLQARYEQQKEPLRQTGKNFNELSERVSREKRRQRELERKIYVAEKGTPLQPPPSSTRFSEAEEDIIPGKIDPDELKRLVKKARDKDPYVRTQAVESLVAYRNQPEVVKALLGLTRGMAWNPWGRFINVISSRAFWVLYFCWVGGILVFRIAPEFSRTWSNRLITAISLKIENVKWLESLEVMKWLEKLTDLYNQVVVGFWAKFMLGALIALSPFLIGWIIGRFLRHGRSKRAMAEVTYGAIRALQSWKGDVSRFTLWRVGNLARTEPWQSEKALRTILQAWEQQQFRDSSR